MNCACELNLNSAGAMRSPARTIRTTSLPGPGFTRPSTNYAPGRCFLLHILTKSSDQVAAQRASSDQHVARPTVLQAWVPTSKSESEIDVHLHVNVVGISRTERRIGERTINVIAGEEVAVT